MLNKIKFVIKSFIDIIIFLLYKLFFMIKREKKVNVWLISERGNEARDNGYWFYKYMKDNHPEIKVKYVITKDSSDYNKINPEDVVEYRSKEHYYYFLYAAVLISAQIMGFSPNERLYYRLNKYGFLNLKSKTIFLQHGITKDFNPYMLKKNTKLDLFICGANPEKNYIIKEYGYRDKEVAYTGFSRFDNLCDLNEKIILVMPTWRKYLNFSDSIKDSEFYKYYMTLLNDNDISSLLNKYNYKLIFYPHILFQKYLHEFSVSSDNVILASVNDYDVQDLLKRSSLLITDFSSVAFDFAYMNKKTIYYQFDLNEYRKTQYYEGYYNYENDGFGPVVYSYDDLKTKLIDFIVDNNSLDNYNSRIDNFFTIKDNNNCERIYSSILNLLK